jgi:hypothetical protein
MLMERILKIEEAGADAEIKLTEEEQREYKRNIVGRDSWYHNSDNPEGTFDTIYFRPQKPDIKKREAIKEFFKQFEK